MPDMTDEEYDALDELWTKTTPKVNFAKPGVFARQRTLLEILDKVTANYIITKAEATNQTPAQVIGEMVQQKYKGRGVHNIITWFWQVHRA